LLQALASNSTIVNGSSTEPFYTILGAALGAFISFFLFIAWDSWRASKQNEAERKRILGLLAVEATENILRGEQIQSILYKELVELVWSSGDTYIPSPPFLSSDGWTIAKAGNLLKHIGEKNLQKWILAYSNLALVNDNLRGRELFKGSSHALQSYQENMRRYDGAIVTGTAVYLQRNQEALDTLPTEVRVPMKITTSPPRSYQRKKPRP
jgi:hypothetical protein